MHDSTRTRGPTSLNKENNVHYDFVPVLCYLWTEQLVELSGNKELNYKLLLISYIMHCFKNGH